MRGWASVIAAVLTGVPTVMVVVIPHDATHHDGRTDIVIGAPGCVAVVVIVVVRSIVSARAIAR